MSLQMFLHDLYDFLRFVCVYYATILGFCALMSVTVIGIIMLLRSTLLSGSIFGKAALWVLMIPCLFCGKLHFYVESEAGVKLFYWWYAVCGNWHIICLMYMLGVICLAVWLMLRRRKLHRSVRGLDDYKEDISRFKIKVTDEDVSSFCTGCIKPVIVISDRLENAQIQTIIKHEETHIMLGHLWIQLLWEVIRILLWPNVFLHICEKYLKRDLEDVCDAVTMQRNGIGAVQYGEILLDNVKRLSGIRGISGTGSGLPFFRDDNYMVLRKRLERVMQHRKYDHNLIMIGTLLSIVLVITMIVGIKTISYARYNPMDLSGIYSEETMEMLAYDRDESIVTYDDKFIYIDCAELKRQCPEIVNEEKDIYFSVGGYYKFPGMGGGSDIGMVSAQTIAENDGVIKTEKYSGIDFWNRLIMWL
ncbi:M56 family metallopeptidase [Lachnospiraceae bacterium C1.1]|nr:M56 family metallopeptidase [Lachnospiraceae bacterium C1.1]